MHHCNTVCWAWVRLGLICWIADCFPSVHWHCWLCRLTCKSQGIGNVSNITCINNYALYKSTHSLTHSPILCSQDAKPHHTYSSLPTHTHTHTFNGPFSRTTLVSRYQKGKTNLDFTEARDSEWQWHQLGRMQVCTSLQKDNHASTPPLSFYRPDALLDSQPTVSKH